MQLQVFWLSVSTAARVPLFLTIYTLLPPVNPQPSLQHLTWIFGGPQPPFFLLKIPEQHADFVRSKAVQHLPVNFGSTKSNGIKTTANHLHQYSF